MCSKLFATQLSFGLCKFYLSFELFDWLIDEKNMQFCTIENHQMAYEYHINENVILSWYQLLIRLRTGATYLVSSEWFEKDMFQLDLCSRWGRWPLTLHNQYNTMFVMKKGWRDINLWASDGHMTYSFRNVSTVNKLPQHFAFVNCGRLKRKKWIYQNHTNNQNNFKAKHRYRMLKIVLFAKRRHRIETKLHVFLYNLFLEKDCGKSAEDYPLL